MKRLLLFFVLICFVVGSTACVKPASTAPKSAEVTPTDTVESAFPLPGESDDIMNQLESFATQTAIAMTGGVQTTEEPAVLPEEGTPVTGSEEVPTVEATPVPAQSEDTTAAIVVPTATPGLPKTYTLKKGEHPYCIARRYNVNPAEMLRLSGLTGSSTYYQGTVLKIPQSGSSFPGKRALKAHPTTYTVVSGDTIYSIACIFGDVDPEAIAYANNLKPPYKLSPGEKLRIP